MDNDNIVKFGKREGPTTPEEKTIPQYPYIITDMHGDEYYAKGFLLFTTHHVAVMRDTGLGPIPVIVMPLGEVHSAILAEEADEDDDVEGYND